MKKVTLSIGGMTCSACSSGLEKYLNKKDGIISASVNLVLAQASIEYDEKKINFKDFDKIISDAGFRNLGEYDILKENKKNYQKELLFVYLLFLIILMYTSMSHMFNFPTLSFMKPKNNPVGYGVSIFLLTIPFLIYGFDIIKNGIKNIIYRHPNMDSLVTTGVLASFLYSFVNLILIINGDSNLVENLYFESCAMVIYFVKLGRFIDHKSKEKTKKAIKELVQITPTKAKIESDGKIIEVTLDEIKKGDILVCSPGDRFAVDGIIIEGNTHIDESFITGESIPTRKSINSKVVAGSICIDGFVKYKAERIGKDSTISEIVRLVIDASSSKAPIAKIADTISSYFVPSIFIIAIITCISYLLLEELNSAVIHFVSVLVVACPCALGLATPLAIVVSEGKCAKEGILVKSSEILENISKIDTIIFDKTGILTYGKLKVSKVFNYSKISDNEILKYVSALEKQSTHPISNAFKDIKTNYLLDDFKNIPGIGLFGVIDDKEIYIGNNKIIDKLKIENKHIKDEKTLLNDSNSIIYVIINKEIVSLIGVKDILRNESKSVIKDLKKLNRNVIMLSGDSKIVASNIGTSIGIEKIIADVVPTEKEEAVKEEMKNHKVMMVGDGINDALALSVADVGLSINSGTDIAIDTADVILMNDNLENIVKLIEISKRTIKIIKENLFWAFFYNICMIPIAIGLFSFMGLTLTPVLGSIAMTISSLTVVINSLRLRK